MKKCLAMGMTSELIRKEYKRKKSSSVNQSSHNEMVCEVLFDIVVRMIDKNTYLYSEIKF